MPPQGGSEFSDPRCIHSGLWLALGMSSSRLVPGPNNVESALEAGCTTVGSAERLGASAATDPHRIAGPSSSRDAVQIMSRLRLPVAVVCGLATGMLVGIPGVSGALAHARRSPGARLAGGCPYADAPVTGSSAPVLRSATVCLINHERAERGLPVLSTSSRLNAVAQHQTQTMVATGIFSHGSNFAQRLTDGGYDWRAAGENIASGFATPQSVVAAWMASPDHCRNILSPMYRNVGTGVATAGVGAGVGAGTWTQDFGLLMRRSVPSRNTRPEDGCPYG